MGIAEFFGRNQPRKKFGGQAGQNTASGKHGRSDNSAKKIKKTKKKKGE